MAFWSEIARSLERIACALEEIAGKKHFVQINKRVKIEELTGEEAEQELKDNLEKEQTKNNEIMTENKGNFLWEEDNLAEASEDYEPE